MGEDYEYTQGEFLRHIEKDIFFNEDETEISNLVDFN